MHNSTFKYWLQKAYNLLCRFGFKRPIAFASLRKITHRLIYKYISDYQSIQGWLTNEDAITLYTITGLLQSSNNIVVEIGAWKGKSTYCLAKGLESQGKLIIIDPFNAVGEAESSEAYLKHKGEIPLEQQFVDNMTRLGVLKNITIWQGYSSDFVNKLQDINFLFIDGDHSIKGCDFDYSNYASYIVPGGYLAFHDYDPNREELGPTWVIKNRVLPSGQYTFIGLFGSVWVAQKNG